MKMTVFAKRNLRELIRDPLTLIFGLGFPLTLMLIFSLMQKNIPELPPVFQMNTLAPGLAVFGFSFITLFLALLMATDRDSSFLTRLFAAPLRGVDFISGYALPLIPFAVVQGAICFGVALLLGLTPSIWLLFGLLMLIPCAMLYISIGLLFGAVFTSKQVGGMSSILINLAAWLSGTWFPVESLGKGFTAVCRCLPFLQAVELVRAATAGNLAGILVPLLWVLGWTAAIFGVAVWLFSKNMKN